MNFWSVLAIIVIVLKLVGVITLGWLAVIGITVLLLFSPVVILLVTWFVTVVLFGAFAGIMLGGAWCLDKIRGTKRPILSKGKSGHGTYHRTVGSFYRADRRKLR